MVAYARSDLGLAWWFGWSVVFSGMVGCVLAGLVAWLAVWVWLVSLMAWLDSWLIPMPFVWTCSYWAKGKISTIATWHPPSKRAHFLS